MKIELFLLIADLMKQNRNDRFNGLTNSRNTRLSVCKCACNRFVRGNKKRIKQTQTTLNLVASHFFSFALTLFVGWARVLAPQDTTIINVSNSTYAQRKRQRNAIHRLFE